MAGEVSKSGVFIDLKTGKVVEKQPEEGIQLVPPGGVVTPNAEAQIKAAKAGVGSSAEAVVDLSATDAAQDSREPAVAPTAAGTATRRR